MLVNTPPEDKRLGTGHILLFNGDVIELNNFEQLREYTTTSSGQYQVSREIDSVVGPAGIRQAPKRLYALLYDITCPAAKRGYKGV
jgi:hypothetical protein